MTRPAQTAVKPAQRRALSPPAGPPWDDPIDAAAIAFVDLEMTGLDAALDRVIEVCIERVVGGRVVASLSTLVSPGDGRFGNEHIHGISAASLESAPSFATQLGAIAALLEGAVPVAHGASYDIAFLEAEFARAGAPVKLAHYLDTLTLSRRAFGFKSHALAALAVSLGIDVARSHRAQDDVRTLRSVFDAVVRELGPKTLRDLWNVEIGKKLARPAVLEALAAARGSGAPVRIRYRPSGKAATDLLFVVTAVRSELDPPQVLGYLLPGRGRRELRADRILSVSPP